MSGYESVVDAVVRGGSEELVIIRYKYHGSSRPVEDYPYVLKVKKKGKYLVRVLGGGPTIYDPKDQDILTGLVRIQDVSAAKSVITNSNTYIYPYS